MTELTWEQMEQLAWEDHQRNLQLIQDKQEQLRVKWEPTGILGEINRVEDQRTMATLLESQLKQLEYMNEKYDDASIASIMKEQYTKWLDATLLPLTARVFRPIISDIRAMGLPAGLGERSTIVARTRRLGEIQHIKTFNCTGYYPIDCESEYFDAVCPLLTDMYIQSMEEERARTPDKKVNFYVYMPLILGTLRDMELNPIKFGVTTRYAVERISDA
jgi:hypothetical protein